MKRAGVFLMFSLVLLVLVGCTSSDGNKVSDKEKKLVSEELATDLDYTGTYTIVHVSSGGSGLGSPVNRTLTLTLDDLNSQEIKVIYELSTFGRVTDETAPSVLLDSYVEDYLLVDMTGLSYDEVSLNVLEDWNSDEYFLYDNYSNLDKLNILLGKTDYTVEDYLTEVGDIKSIEIFIDTEKTVLNNQRILDLFNTVRNNTYLDDYEIYAKDSDIIYDIDSTTDDPSVPLSDLGFANAHYVDEDTADVDYTIQANFANSTELGSFEPDLYKEHGLKYVQLIMNDSKEEFSVWGMESMLFGEDGTMTRFTRGGSSNNLYLHRLNNVINAKLASTTNLSLLGDIVIFDDEGYPFKRIAGLTEYEIRAQLEKIAYVYNNNFKYGVVLNDSVFDVDMYDVSEYIYEVGKLLPNLQGGIIVMYSPDEELRHNLKYHTEMTLAMRKEITNVEKYDYSTSEVERYKSIEVLHLYPGKVFDDSDNLISIDGIGNELLNARDSLRERMNKQQ